MKLSKDSLTIVILAVLVAALSAYPFHPLRTPGEVIAMGADFLAYAIEPPILRTLLERVILFTPIGFFAARALRGARLRVQLAVLLVWGVLFCLFVEMLQLPVEGRHARSSDALLAVVCLMFGYALAARLYHPVLHETRRIIGLASVTPCVLALGAWAV